MEEVTVVPDLKKQAVTNGLIWAAINIAIFLIVYYVKPDLMGSFTYKAIELLVGIGLAVYFCLDLRTKAGGFFSFKQALGLFFIMFVLQAVIVFLFTIVFGKFIEPEYATRMAEISRKSTIELMEKMGASDEQIDEALSKNEEIAEKQFNPGPAQIAMGLAIVTIMYFIGALIFAAIFKKERPVFETIEE